MSSNEPVIIAFVRHGETDWNAEGRFQGASDTELNATGTAQATNSVEFLRENGPWDELRFSPLRRAANTGAIIADALGIEDRRMTPNLAERDWGAAEGHTLAELREAHPWLSQYKDPDVREQFPGVEPLELVVARGRFVIDNLVHTRPGKRVLCATHGSIFRVTLNDLLDEPIGFVPNTGAIMFRAWQEEGDLKIEVLARSFTEEQAQRAEIEHGAGHR